MGKFYRTNQYIQAREVRVVDEDGKQIGILPIFNAIQKARETGVDLVEVSPNAKPPVCKIIDFKKFKYIEAKKEKEEKRGQKGGELKEIRLTPFIAENDLNTRLKRIKEFLGENNKVKIRIKFSGRQLGKKDFGYRILERLASELAEVGVKDSEAKFLGKELFMTFAPKKASGKVEKNEKQEKQDENQQVVDQAH